MMDEGKILAQGTFEEMNQVDEFKELMKINELNKNSGDKKDAEGSDKDSAEGDTVTEDDVDSDELTEEDADSKKQSSEEMLEMIKNRSSRLYLSKKHTSKKSKLKKALGEESSEVESGDEGANDDKEEKLPEVVYPSKLTYAQKLQKIAKFQEVKEKKVDATDLKNTIDDQNDEEGDEFN